MELCFIVGTYILYTVLFNIYYGLGLWKLAKGGCGGAGVCPVTIYLSGLPLT